MHKHHTQEAQAGHAPPIGAAVATLICLILGLLGGLFLWLDFPNARNFMIVASLGAYVAGGIGPTRNAFDSLRRGELNVDLLMILAAVGAAIIGDFLEGVVLLFLFSLSGTLENFAMYRTSRSIQSLIQLRPLEASRLNLSKGEEERVLVENLKIGDIIRVRPGERFAIDGEVTEGESWANEATLTGESELIHKKLGSTVFSGTINHQGSVSIRMTKEVEDTTLEKIVQLVQDAQSQKTPTQRMVESWQQPYVIGVLVAALLVFIGSYFIHNSDVKDAFYHAMVLLVAASPCAVVVSTPSVMLSAIARAGRQGVLFKGALHLENLGQVDVMALDKTGTVTLGKPAVTEIWIPSTCNADQLLALVAAVEGRSEHPLRFPIIEHAKKKNLVFDVESVTDFQSVTGLGVQGRVAGVLIGVGREGLFTTLGTTIPDALQVEADRLREAGQTVLMVVTSDPAIFGAIAVSDQIRPEAVETIAALKKLGIHHIVILTGDHPRVARKIASMLGTDDVRAGLMPEQKVIELGKLAQDGGQVAMVGDGVNDAPALATAMVGIAMGGAGTDVALEVADVVLMRDDLKSLPFALWISRVARRRVRQNMIFAFSMIGILVLSTFFQLPLWLGVLGHEGSTVLVVFNGLRMLWERAPNFDGHKTS